jgi:hypothetical protein
MLPLEFVVHNWLADAVGANARPPAADALASKTEVAIPLLDLFPRPFPVSDTATHAPTDSFQTDL